MTQPRIDNVRRELLFQLRSTRRPEVDEGFRPRSAARSMIRPMSGPLLRCVLQALAASGQHQPPNSRFASASPKGDHVKKWLKTACDDPNNVDALKKKLDRQILPYHRLPRGGPRQKGNLLRGNTESLDLWCPADTIEKNDIRNSESFAATVVTQLENHKNVEYNSKKLVIRVKASLSTDQPLVDIDDRRRSPCRQCGASKPGLASGSHAGPDEISSRLWLNGRLTGRSDTVHPSKGITDVVM